MRLGDLRGDSGNYLRGAPQIQIWDWNQIFDPKKHSRGMHRSTRRLDADFARDNKSCVFLEWSKDELLTSILHSPTESSNTRRRFLLCLSVVGVKTKSVWKI